jgi:hypothetical protein
MVDFPESLTVDTDSHYAERDVLHIETTELIQDSSESTLLFIQLHQVVRNWNHLLYITHIRSHMGLPGSLTQGNDKIYQLLIGNVLEVSEFHKRSHINSKGLKKDFSIIGNKSRK